MFISQDFSYIKASEMKLIDSGYGKMSVHSVHFDRHFTEEKKENNRKTFQTMTTEEWNKHCLEISKSFDKPLREILSVLVGRYNIHQVSTETSTMKHYRSDWDLFFYSNKGWNGNEHMDCFRLSFNDKRSVEQNMKLLEEIISIVKTLDYENIGCRIQYDAWIDKKKVEETAKDICENLLGEFINYNGMVGKIKVVGEYNGNKEYGFFKKNARNKYYRISYGDILSMNI